MYLSREDRLPSARYDCDTVDVDIMNYGKEKLGMGRKIWIFWEGNDTKTSLAFFVKVKFGSW